MLVDVMRAITSPLQIAAVVEESLLVKRLNPRIGSRAKPLFECSRYLPVAQERRIRDGAFFRFEPRREMGANCWIGEFPSCRPLRDFADKRAKLLFAPVLSGPEKLSRLEPAQNLAGGNLAHALRASTTLDSVGAPPDCIPVRRTPFAVFDEIAHEGGMIS